MEPVIKSLLATSVAGTLAGAAGAVVAQATPIISGNAEQITVVGAAVAGVLYLRSQNAALRDDLKTERATLARLHEAQTAAAKEQTDRLVAVIEAGHVAKTRLSDSQAQLTAVVNDMRVTLTGVQGVLADVREHMETRRR